MTLKRYLVIVFILAASAAPLTVKAEDILNANRLAVIQQRCTVLQTSLDQLQRRDLVARTNRGREYENVNRQIDAFMTRLQHNNIPSTSLDTPVSDFKAAVMAFRNAYLRYDDSMTNLRAVDCNSHVSSFAQTLETTRLLRVAVGVEVTKSEKALSNFRRALTSLQPTLPKSLEGAKQ